MKIRDKVLALLLLAVMVHVGARVWCNYQRSTISEGWVAVAGNSPTFISNVIYASEHPKNKVTVWLMRQGF